MSHTEGLWIATFAYRDGQHVTFEVSASAFEIYVDDFKKDWLYLPLVENGMAIVNITGLDWFSIAKDKS